MMTHNLGSSVHTIPLSSLSERAIAERLMVRDFQRFEHQVNFLLANSSAIALWIIVLEVRNHEDSARLMKEG